MTPLQRKCLQYLKEYSSENDGEMPTYQMIADHISQASKSGVHRLITSLERAGYITRIEGVARSMRLVTTDQKAERLVAALRANHTTPDGKTVSISVSDLVKLALWC